MTFDLRRVLASDVAPLVAEFHGYGSMGNAAVYAFGVYEDGRMVAGYAWQPPPVGAARAVCPEAPSGVLALSRMVACDKKHRRLKHVSKPLRAQMKRWIDRGRWPVLVTYSDEGQGHNGYVYQCSGWEKTARRRAKFYVNAEGKRASSYSNGRHGGRGLKFGGWTVLQRWEHRVSSRGSAALAMKAAGWRREAIAGKTWKSGNQAHHWVKEAA